MIDVSFRVPGLHFWSGATGRREYLRHPHRHMFHIRVSVEVSHDDREIEFHDLKDDAGAMFQSFGEQGNFGGQSCEHLARRLAGCLVERHRRAVSVHVSEDGEFGATVICVPET